MNRAADDLISRAVLIDELMAGCMPLDLPGLSGVTGDELTIRNYIDSAPAVDAAPVVRCKDCKHRPTITRGTDGDTVTFPDWRCPFRCDDGWYNWYPDDDWFCGNGKRREGNCDG